MGSERISTHALTEGDSAFRGSRLSIAISTHALTEGDGRRIWKRVTVAAFQLTPSRRATDTEYEISHNADISTHALTEGDSLSINLTVIIISFQLTPSRRATAAHSGLRIITRNFNSRPHGGRQERARKKKKTEKFQLTPSRRATG